MSEKKVLRKIDSYTSDHLPIHMSIVCEFQESEIHQSTNLCKNIVKIKWEKTDKDYYSALVGENYGHK